MVFIVETTHEKVHFMDSAAEEDTVAAIGKPTSMCAS